MRRHRCDRARVGDVGIVGARAASGPEVGEIDAEIGQAGQRFPSVALPAFGSLRDRAVLERRGGSAPCRSRARTTRRARCRRKRRRLRGTRGRPACRRAACRVARSASTGTTSVQVGQSRLTTATRPSGIVLTSRLVGVPERVNRTSTGQVLHDVVDRVVKIATSAGSMAGKRPIRSWLRPSLRYGSTSTMPLARRTCRDRRGVDVSSKSMVAVTRLRNAGSVTNGVVSDPRVGPRVDRAPPTSSHRPGRELEAAVAEHPSICSARRNSVASAGVL